ncbi:UPF0175 family protein [Prosthecobacter sp. SYSU 5D2]|uniref:UPF0175 family protein n=1 Tax=Prosthecobacter sp. SYSU 5D2 TaxID=3134134 RepID=UPI0031FF14E2
MVRLYLLIPGITLKRPLCSWAVAPKFDIEYRARKPHFRIMTLILDFPDSWQHLLGLDADNPAQRAREMLVIEGYREGRLSRGQTAEMLGLGFHETEALLKRHGADQQATWEEMEAGTQAFKALLRE